MEESGEGGAAGETAAADEGGGPAGTAEAGGAKRAVIVAVIDTGVDRGHPALAGIGEGWDFVEGDGDLSGETLAEAHGTHVAGTIMEEAARRGADVAVTPLKAFENGKARTSDVVAATNSAGLLDMAS